MSKIYKIPVVWHMCDIIEITADSYEEACEKVYDVALTKGDFLEGSFEIDEVFIEENNPEYLEENTNQNN